MRAATYCRNCSLFLGEHPGKFCPNCGQSTALHPPTVREFAHEFVGHYVALEGRLARTLALLVFMPGELTRRYLAGQKERYVNPLRLYLTVSLVFFLALKVGSMIGMAEVLKVSERKETVNAGVQLNTRGYAGVQLEAGDVRWSAPAKEAVQCDVTDAWCANVRSYLESRHADKTVGQLVAHVQSRVVSLAPYAAFLLLPVFAWMTWLLYWRRKFLYGEHLVYAMHVHSFAFLAAMALELLPKAANELLTLAVGVYFFIAMQRFFGGRRWVNAIRYIALAIVYPLVMLIAMAVSFLLALFI